MPLEAAPIRAQRAGAVAADGYALPVEAVGDVEGRSVADVGAGRGRHLHGLARKVGARGRLVATEISESGCAGLNDLVTSVGLENVSVVLGDKTDVGLEPASVDVVLLSDVYQFVTILDGRSGQDKHRFLLSLRRALVPGGEVVVTYVTSARLKQEETRDELLETTLADFRAYGFEVGRRWILDGPHWPVLVLEFRAPESGPVAPLEYMDVASRRPCTGRARAGCCARIARTRRRARACCRRSGSSRARRWPTSAAGTVTTRSRWRGAWAPAAASSAWTSSPRCSRC